MVLFSPVYAQAQLIGGDVNKPVNQVYFIGNNNVGSNAPAFTVTAPGTCSNTGSVRIVWNGGTTSGSLRQIAMHGGLQYNGTQVAGSSQNLNSGNSFTYTFSNLQPGIYTFSLSRDPYDDRLNTNNVGAGAADDWSTAGGNSIGDQQRCAVLGVIILPTAGNLPNITATAQGATSCISSVGSVTITGLTPGQSYQVASTVGGAYVNTGVIPASGQYTLAGLYPGNYPVRVRLVGTTCYRELNMKVPSPAGIPCFTTDELIDFAPSGTSLITNGNYGTSAATMPSLAGNAGITDYTLVAINSGQPQDSRYSIARSTNNADNGGTNAFTWRLRNLTYPTQGNHIFACLQFSKDHTGSLTQADGTTNGYMMVVNANYKTDRVLYLTGLNLIAGRTYQFSFWAKNLQPFMPKNKNNGTADGEPTYQPIVPRLGVVVNGIIYDFAELGYVVEPATYTASTYLTQMGWEQFKVRFTAPVNNATSNVGIYNLQQGGFGNDFLIDDVELYEITYIGDKVWNDLDKDGRQDANEPGMANVTVTLNDGSGNPIKTTVSDAFGNYKFYVPYSTATYSVTFIPPPNYSFSPQVGTGSTDATDSDPNQVTGRTANFNLSPGSSQKDMDCGLMFNTPTQYASIGDFVFMDANQSGVQDPGEPGISGVVISLFNSSGILVGSTISDAQGFYRFDRVAAGQYKVGVTTPPGSLITNKDIGGNDNYDSDINPAGLNYAQTDLITAIASTAINNVDIGLYMTPVSKRSIGDKIWNDINNNGIQDVGEPGLPSVQVSLYLAGADKLAGTGDDVLSANIITDGFGFYQFNNLDSIPYFIKVSIPTGYALTNPNLGANDYADSDFDLLSRNSQVIDFANGVINVYHVDGGLRLISPPPNWSSIGDVVWTDLDVDGIQDANESLMPSITVTLYTAGGSVVATTATDSLGRYRFVNVAPGNYKLGFSNLPDGYLFSLQDRGGNDNLDSDVDALTGETAVFALPGGVVNLSFDAALRYGKNPGTASVGNKVWLDYDNDGVQDEDETGIAYVTVTLREAGPDGVFGNGDDVVYTTVTNSLGEYSFTNLPSAPKYRIEYSNINTTWFTMAAKNTGSNYDLDSDGNPFVGTTSTTDAFGLAEGEQRINVALGLQLNTSSNRVIGDRVWLDLNGNGIQDASETRGIPGVTVDLLDVSGNLVTQSGRVVQTTTNQSGYYRFYGLANGTYFPRFSNLPQGFKLAPTDVGANDLVDNDVNGINGRVTVGLPITSAARANMSGDLGLVPLTSYVGDYVWNDVNGNGLQDANEEGLPGVTVTIYNTNGDALGSTVTNSMGQYYFFNVTPGSYTMGFTTFPTVMEFTIKEGSPAANGSDVNRFTGRTDVFVVAAGVAYTDIDAGLRATYIGQVGDYVWEDRNQDGVQDADEPGISGVTIRLVNLLNSAVIGEAITKGNGFFQFFTVPIEVPLQAQFYNVPGSYSFTLPNQGNGNNDSKVNATGFTISNFSLPYSIGVYNIDAGIIRPIILPVTGVVLQAERHNKWEVALNWTTLTEENAVDCIVERSSNGQQFSTVGKVKAVGNSSTQLKYQFLDRNAPSGVVYYRIKVTDRNGKVVVSNVAVLSERSSAGVVTLYPNPVKENLYVGVPKAGKYKIDILSANGQTVSSTMFQATQAGQTIQLGRGNYAAGLYRVSILSMEDNELSKVFPVLFE